METRGVGYREGWQSLYRGGRRIVTVCKTRRKGVPRAQRPSGWAAADLLLPVLGLRVFVGRNRDTEVPLPRVGWRLNEQCRKCLTAFLILLSTELSLTMVSSMMMLLGGSSNNDGVVVVCSSIFIGDEGRGGVVV